MIVVYSDERARFEAVTSYLERHIPKEQRWRWDPAVKRWWARSEDIARRLAQYATGNAALRLNALSPAEQAALAASTASDSDLAVPAPPGLDYLPYQRAGIAYALERAGTLIADEMGLGKTIQAIGVVNSITISRALIVCPASLRLNWAAEWRRWHTGRLRATLLDTWPGGLFDATEGKALIVSYDSVQKWHPMIAATDFDALILDEAHLIKDEGTRRAKAILGGKYRGQLFNPIQARRKLLLSGTPIVNRPAELWPLVKLLAPEGLGASKVDFLERYTGPERLAELHLRLRTQIMVRRRKDDVLKDLPAKRRQVVLLDVPDAEGILEAEGKAVSLAQAMIERTKAEIEGLPHQAQVMRLRQCRAIAMSEISKVRKETALKKLPQAIEHIHEVLGNVDKVVIFAWHHEILDAIARAFGGKAQRPDRENLRPLDGNWSGADEIPPDDVAMPVRLRNGETAGWADLEGGKVQGVHVVPPDEARNVTQPRVHYVDSGEGESEEERRAIRSGLARHSDPDALPTARHRDQADEPEGTRQQSVPRSPGAGEGLHQGQRVGHQLARERNQRGRQPAGADGDFRAGLERTRAPIVVQLDGRTPQADRNAAIIRFQNDRSCRVFVGSIRAAGLGITLTAASTVVFVELDWTPAMMMQSEDRLHRIGQINPVLAQHLVIDGSLDAKMSRILIDKQAIMDAALDGGATDAAQSDILTEVMRA